MKYTLHVSVPEPQVEFALESLRHVRVLIQGAGGHSQLKKDGGRLTLTMDARAEILVAAVDAARSTELVAVKQQALIQAEARRAPDMSN